MVDEQTGALGHLGVAATFGLVAVAMVAALGHISGAHFNSAVTVAFSLVRHFPHREIPAYVGAQLAGAVAGAAILRGLFGPDAFLGATVPAGSAAQSFVVELLLTAVLMLVITAVACRGDGDLARALGVLGRPGRRCLP